MEEGLAELILGASYSIDVVVQASFSSRIPFEDAVYLADQRLDRRWIIGRHPSVSTHELPNEGLISQLKENRWQFQGYDKPATMNFVLVDNETALIEPLSFRSEEGPRFVVSNSSIIEELRKGFDQLWGDTTEAVYEEPSNIWTPDAQQRIVTASEDQWNRIIAILSQDPKQLYEIDPRKFEELIANLLERDGLDVELTPPKNDGGRDILAFANTSVGRHLYLVECKRYSENNPVGVSLVRALYGVVVAERATAGLLVTTSRFTKGAMEFSTSVNHQMGLKDYRDLVKWIHRAGIQE